MCVRVRGSMQLSRAACRLLVLLVAGCCEATSQQDGTGGARSSSPLFESVNGLHPDRMILGGGGDGGGMTHSSLTSSGDSSASTLDLQTLAAGDLGDLDEQADSDLTSAIALDEHCPSQCVCLDLTVDCSLRQLTQLPRSLPAHLHTLKLNGNDIAALDENALRPLTKLRSIVLRENRGIHVAREAFVFNTMLQRIDMSGCELGEIPELQFNSSASVVVNLSENNITRLNSVMWRLSGAVTLDVSYNQLTALRLTAADNDTTLPALASSSATAEYNLYNLNVSHNMIEDAGAGVLAVLSNNQLRSVRLSHNRLQHLDRHAFSGLPDLARLDLSHNLLKSVDALVFSGLRKLAVLQLSHNNIVQLATGAFINLPSLSQLFLDHNRIGNVSSSWLHRVDSVDTLTLAHNRLTSIGTDTWQYCSRRLQRLSLAHNRLTAIEHNSLRHLSSLRQLKLAHNQLASVHSLALSHVPQLSELELDDNHLSDVLANDSVGVFRHLGQLSRLSLADNNVTSLSQHVFDGLTSLHSLSLGHVHLSRLNDAVMRPLSSLTRLTLFSERLQCDCRLGWLPDWLRQRDLVTSGDGEVRLFCVAPASLRGRSLLQVETELTCVPATTAAVVDNEQEEETDSVPSSLKPSITRQPAADTVWVLRGHQLTLQCHASTAAVGDSALSFQWLRDGVPLPATAQGVTVVNEAAVATAPEVVVMRSRLGVASVDSSHAGSYQCRVNNAHGVAVSRATSVRVHAIPEFTRRPSDVRVRSGSTAVLQCAAAGLPAPTVRWRKDGGGGFPAAVERRLHVAADGGEFHVVDVRPADAGVYTCVANNTAGRATANATITVLERATFVAPLMRDQRVPAGSTAVMRCSTAGSPPARVVWSRDSLPLTDGGGPLRYFFTANGQVLVIVSVTHADAGLYTCQLADSSAAEASQSDDDDDDLVSRHSARLDVVENVSQADSDEATSPTSSGHDSDTTADNTSATDDTSSTLLLVAAVLAGCVVSSALWLLLWCALRRRRAGKPAASSGGAAGGVVDVFSTRGACGSDEVPLEERQLYPSPSTSPVVAERLRLLTACRPGGGGVIVAGCAAGSVIGDTGSEHSKDSGQSGHEDSLLLHHHAHTAQLQQSALAGGSVVDSEDESAAVGTPLLARRCGRVLTTFQANAAVRPNSSSSGGGGLQSERASGRSLASSPARVLYADRRQSQLADETGAVVPPPLLHCQQPVCTDI